MLSPTTSGMLMIRNGQSRSCAHTQRQRTNANIHLVLGDIDTRDNEIILCHHPAPFLARSGLQAHATVRVEEDTGSVPRSPAGSWPSSTNGLRFSDGRLVRTARSHILADFADTRARRKPLKPLRAGMPGDSGVLVYSCASLPMQSAHEAAGATGIRCSPRPLRGGRFINGSGALRGEVANACLEFSFLRN